MFVLVRVAAPSTVKLLSICTLLLGTYILPVPFALSSRSAFDSVVVIKLSCIVMSAICA